jgi:hypothetical protein
MEIYFNENRPQKPKKAGDVFWKQGFFYLGKQKRVATVTDVKFVDDTLLIVAHRAAARLYLLEKTDNVYNQVDSIILRKGSKFFHPDLITVKNYKVYMTDYTNILTIVDIDKPEKKLERIQLKNIGKCYHGCSHDDTYIYLGGVNVGKPYITLLHTETEQIIHIPFPIKTRIKSLEKITINEKDHLILGIDDGKPTKRTSSVVLCELNIDNRSVTIVDRLDLPSSQIDAAAQNRGSFYFCVHIENDKGYIYKYHIEDMKLKFDKRVEVSDFPHGLDTIDDVVVYSSYTTSSIKFLDITDFQ